LPRYGFPWLGAIEFVLIHCWPIDGYKGS
jgi:hypothetical protein